MAIYVSYTPNTLIEKAMFNFDIYGLSNFKYSGPIRVSVSDGFSYNDWYYGNVNNINLSMFPLNPEFLWSSSDLANIDGALDILSNYAGLNFSSVADYDTVGIYSLCTPYNVGLAGVSDINIAFTYRPSSNLGISAINLDSSFGYVGAKGDIFINFNGSSFNDGLNFADYTKSRQVLLHELCHSLGLSHPFDTNYITTSDYSALVNAGFQNLGFVINSGADLNKEYFTIMSYDDESNISGLNAYTPMIFDVIALQGAYGEGRGTSGTGNDLIQAGNIGYRTYFDKGGTDTIDTSPYTSGCYLNMGTSIVGASHQVGLLTSNEDAKNLFNGISPESLRWFYGEYENAIGSSAFDLILGNSLNNNIQAGAGDDYVYGLDGNDIIDCGQGANDVCAYALSISNYNVTYRNEIFTVTSLNGTEGTDTVSNVEFFLFYDQTIAASTFIDTIPPTIAISSNDSNLIAGETATISFTLSEPSSNFALNDLTASGGSLSNFNGTGISYTVVFTPTTNSTTNGVVNVTSGRFTDTAGNNNEDGSDTNNTVTMTVDTIPPVLLSVNESNGASDIALNSNISIKFNEAIKSIVGTVNLYNLTTNKLIQTFDLAKALNVTASDSTITINPTKDFAYNTAYYLQVSLAQDLSGNSMALTTKTFTSTNTYTTVANKYTLSTTPNNLIYSGANNFTGTGNKNDNIITGNIGNDILDGAAGADRLIGGAGNDTYVVDNTGDVITENSNEGIDTLRVNIGTAGGTYSLTDNVENATLVNKVAFSLSGNGLNNVLTGNAAANIIVGNDGNDMLIGGDGNDILTGGVGQDTFIFNTKLDVKKNLDAITDFASGRDEIQLSKSIFKGITNIGDLSNTAFYSAANAVKGIDADDRIIYNKSTGALYYDADGNGKAAAVQFVALTGNPNLEFSDFIIV